MSTPEAKVVIGIDLLLKRLGPTLKGLDQVEKKLRSVSNVKLTSQISSAQIDKAAIASQRLLQQQQRLSIQAQELANRQERARQATDRLALSQQKLAQQTAKVQKSVGQQADAHVKAFRAIETGAKKNQAEVNRINAQTARQAKEQQAIQERAARSIASAQGTTAKAGANELIDSLNKSGKAGETFDRILNRVGSTLNRIGGTLSSFGRTLTVALTAPLTALGVIALKSASDIDAQVNTLRAFTGSAEAAERRLAQLVATAQRTPGLTTQLGLMLDSQLRLANVTVETIDKVLPAIGRLNAVQKLQDPARFSQNLVQLVTQNFERIDLKELVGQSPVAGQIIKEMFNVDSPINAEAIRTAAKQMGLTTTDAFFTAFADAAARNPALAQVTESIATRFSKFVDRITLALRPLGLGIVNALTPIVNFVVPIIERLGQAFTALPAPIQFVIVAFGGLAAASGPLIFITGQLISGVGTLISTYAQLVAVGLTPSIKGFQLLSQVMRGNAALAAGQAATTAAAAAGWTALAVSVVGAVALLAIAAIAIASYATEQEKAIDVDKEAAAARLRRIPKLKEEIKELEALAKQTEFSAEQQERLKESYESLEGAAKGRVALAQTETERLRELIAARRELLQLDTFESNATALQVVKNLTLALGEQKAAQDELSAARERFKSATIEAASASNVFGARQVTTNDVLAVQEKASLAAAAALEKIGQKGQEVDAAARVIQSLADASEISTEQLLQQAKAAGANADAVEQARKAIAQIIPVQVELGEVIAEANKEILEQNEAFEAGADANVNVIIAESSDKGLRSVIRSIRATTESTEDARRALENYIQLFPQLQKAVERAGGIDAVIDSLTKKKGAKSETSIRNAREQLANALLRIAEAEIEQENTVKRLGNERLLQANENAYRLELIAYRDYLKTRANFTDENLELEASQQHALVINARRSAARLANAALKAGIPEAERVKRQAQSAAEEEKAIRAETKLKEIEEDRAKIADELRQLFAESQKQQIEDIRNLDIEYAELTGRIESALDAKTVDKFRESLGKLGKEQESLNNELKKATAAKDADAIAAIERARNLNQEQIDLIEGIVAQELATNKLTVAQRLVEQAKGRQAELEREIAFDVEFRGLKEEEAIRRRLVGEAKLADSFKLTRDLIQDQIDLLNAQGVQPPQVLLDFIRDTNHAIRGLGELPFSEQFRLAQQEFDRINDLRIQKIQDVERAVRNRDIAEVEGVIIIRRINGAYVGDLEKQLAILKQIAAASGDRGLQQQARSTAETVKDAKDGVADFGRQLESAGKDAARSGFSDFFLDLLNRTKDAKTAALDLLDSIVQKFNEVIAENLSKQLFESLFGGLEDQGGGLFGKIGRLFGLGGERAVVGEAAAHAGDAVQEHAAATAAATTLQAGATAASAALTTGGTAAGTALATGGATASTTIVTGISAAVTAFASTVIAAGAAFAAAVTAASGAQAIGGIGALGGLGAAKGGIFSPITGGRLGVFAEAGYPEAVLTTDPKHAPRQFEILRHYLKQTRGLFGRIPQYAIPRFETGAFISPRQTEIGLLNSITRLPAIDSAIPAAALASGGGGATNVRLRQIITTERLVEDYLSSAEGEQVFVDKLIKNRQLIRSISSRRS